MRKVRIGLVLGGGGARGLAHIGVIKTLHKNGIIPDMIAGCSMGAMVGAAYAQNPDIEYLEANFRNFINSDQFQSLGGARFRRENIYEPEDLLKQIGREFKRRLIINLAAHRKSILKSARLHTAVQHLVREGRIEKTKIPFYCSAIDLVSGNEVIFSEGDIQRAVAASSAIPGFMSPIEYDDYQLVDGAVSINFPIKPLLNLNPDVLIVSNVSAPFEVGHRQDNVIDIIMRSHMIATRKLNRISLAYADYVINPAIGSIHWSEFEKIDQLILRGQEAAEKAVSKIAQIISKKTGMLVRVKKWIATKLISALEETEKGYLK